MDVDPVLFSETFARVLLGWNSDPEHAGEYATMVRDGSTLDVARRALAEVLSWDTTDLLATLPVRTLILDVPGSELSDLSTARELAATIPDATLVSLPGSVTTHPEAYFAEVERFLDDGNSRPHWPAGLRVMLFTDLEGHAAIMDRLGDAAGREVLREHERLIRSSLVEFGGDEVKALGDGFLAAFGGATAALNCAIAIQQRVTASPILGPHGLRVRVGMNAGEPLTEDNDLFGTSVIAASRVAALAGGGEILVADVVRQLAAGKGFAFNDTGEHILRGFEDPTRLWEVRWTPDP